MTPFTVFIGDGATIGTVSQSLVTTFTDFIKETLGHPVLVNLTRAQFHALPKESKARAKRVNFVTPACFKTSPCQRLTENATTFCLIAIDIDDPKQASPFVKEPHTLNLALEPWCFGAYTTASSLPDAPKLRVLVQADNLPVDRYQEAVRAVASRLALADITKESLVVVQPMYLPTWFRDDDYQKFHPLIAANWEGQAVTARELAQIAKPAPTSIKSPASFASVTGEDLDFLRPTVEAITIEDVRDALMLLDPDMVYNEWLEVAAALRHQFPNEPEASEAYELFDEWSAKGDKYVDPDDTKSKWDSLKPSPRGRAPITIRTILHKAQEAGWESSKLATKCYAATMRWMCAQERTGNELMSEGIKRIVATPILSSLERSSMMSAFIEALRSKGMKVQRTDLKRELASLERQSAKRSEPSVTPDSQLPIWARGITYVAAGHEFYHRIADRSLSPESLDACYNAFLMDSDPAANGKPIMTARDYLLNVAKIPRVDAKRYDPANPDVTFIVEGKKRFINTYIPSYPDPVAADATECGDIFMEHIANLLEKEEHQQTLLDWLCYHVQFPGKKIRWAVLLQGAQGCGKTFLVDAMSEVLGKNNVNATDAFLVMRDTFNSWAKAAQLVAIEEIRVVGHNRHEVMNRLKPCISNTHVTVREIFEKPILVPNVVNYIMFTNHHDSLAVSEGDRRYYVLNSVIQNKAQVQALGAGYFSRLYRMIKEKPGGLRSFMENWTISQSFNPDGNAPVTEFLSELTKNSASPIISAIMEMLEEGDNPLVREDLVSSKVLGDLLSHRAGLQKFTDQNISGALREMDYINLGRFRINSDRHYFWVKRGSKWTTAAEAAEIARKRLEAGVPEASAHGFDVVKL